MVVLTAERKACRLSLVFSVFFLGLVVYLFRLQVLDSGTYRNLSEKNRVRVVYLEAPRGRILDCQGFVLATSRLSFNCSAFPAESKTNIHQSLQVLSTLLGENLETLERRYYKGKPGVYNSVVLAEDIQASQAIAVEERLDSLPGILIETKPVREYPYRESTAHILGTIGPITDKEEEELESYGYLLSDWIGRDGIEKSYESVLRGRPGGLQMEVDNRGRFMRALGVREPKEGKDVELTVDGRLQEFIQKELEGQKGSVIVMDLKDGGIVAMNSAPSFNPDLFASTKGRRKLGPFLTDPGAPMVNRGIGAQVPPGSIFKVVTVLAALETSKISEFSTFVCGGSLLVGNSTFHCWKDSGHGLQSLVEAFAHSCNVYFYSAGLLAGSDAIYHQALEFGFSRLTGIDLPSERSGFVPSREWKKKTFGASWYEGETANLAIGQGALQVTPIQALQMIAAIATSGVRIKPHLVNKIDGSTLPERAATMMNRNPRHWRAVKEGLRQAVNSDSGTGRLARVPGLSIAGKTGTAQSGQDRPHAWFVGYSPEQNPKIAMVVFLEQGGRGGVEAATLAATVFQQLKEKNYL